MAKLNSLGFGARLLATFQNGRIEEFLPCVTLDEKAVAVKTTQECIAAKLRRW